MSTKSILKIAAALAASTFCAIAQTGTGYPPPGSSIFFSGKGQIVQTNCAYFITPAKAFGPARVELVNVGSDMPNAKLRFFNPTADDITVTNALGAGGTNILCTGHIGVLLAGDTIVVRDTSSEKYQLLSVSSTNSSGFITTNLFGTPNSTNGMDFALAAGEAKVYKVVLAGEQHVGTQTNTFPQIGNGPMWRFPHSKPGAVLFLQTTAQSTNTTINFISGSYDNLRVPVR